MYEQRDKRRLHTSTMVDGRSEGCLSICGLSGCSSSTVPSLLKASIAMATNKLEQRAHE